MCALGDDSWVSFTSSYGVYIAIIEENLDSVVVYFELLTYEKLLDDCL